MSAKSSVEPNPEREALLVECVQDAVAFIDSVDGLNIDALARIRGRWAGALAALGYSPLRPTQH